MELTYHHTQLTSESEDKGSLLCLVWTLNSINSVVLVVVVLVNKTNAREGQFLKEFFGDRIQAQLSARGLKAGPVDSSMDRRQARLTGLWTVNRPG